MHNVINQTELTTRLQAVLETVVLAIAAFSFAAITGVFLFSLAESANLVSNFTSFRGYLINIVALQVLAFPLLSYVYLELTDRSITYIDIARPSQTQLILTAIGVVGLIAINYSLHAVFVLFNIPIAPNILTDLTDPTQYLILGVVSVLIIGPTEELLFRGVIQKRLTETFSTAAAIIITSGIFSLFHIQALAGSSGVLASIITIFVLSGVLGILYARTKNLLVVMLIHGLFNMFVFIVNYTSAVGYI